eukprot:TRINITY_DN2476_c0_g1_i1.p1 TRINITY_DN2476_c0_g1~~TRINITY_DN2476_c0_g1_i1.p1  ORF type:complete len:251 (+),score=54.84 TRINITY_DN2476_c0_g1_i1:45-755(+)
MDLRPHQLLLELASDHHHMNQLAESHTMADTDLELPKAVIKRVVKNKLSSLSGGSKDQQKEFQVNKDALLAFGESTKVFIQYVACLANEHCKKAKRATLSVEDVFKVLEEIEFADYIEPLKLALAEKKEIQQQNKKRKASEAGNTIVTTEGGEGAQQQQQAPKKSKQNEENDSELNGNRNSNEDVEQDGDNEEDTGLQPEQQEEQEQQITKQQDNETAEVDQEVLDEQDDGNGQNQ